MGCLSCKLLPEYWYVAHIFSIFLLFVKRISAKRRVYSGSKGIKSKNDSRGGGEHDIYIHKFNKNK
jgi:hypothetical protein